MKTFRELSLDTSLKDFMIGAELVTSRGTMDAPDGKKVVKEADEIAEWDAVDWASITDNAGGNPMLAPAILGRRILDRDKDVIVHLACKDRNRNGLESVAWQYDSEGLNNILCLTGDYPVDGYQGIAAPVFDLDSCTLIKMLSDMNSGMKVPGRKKGSTVELPKTNFFLGAAVSQFKNNEAELMCQYLKMELKVKNGCGFLIPQLGYDMRKCHELIAYMKQHQVDVPVFGNIYILNKIVAGIFNKRVIPGCYVSDELLAQIKKAAAGEDKGRGFLHELAARMYAIFKGLGFRGAYFGGFKKISTVKKIVALAESYSEDDWKTFAKEMVYPDGDDFYLYEQDPETGLANPEKDSPEVLASADKVDPNEVTLMYHFNRFVHAAAFEKKSPFYKPMKKMYELLDGKFPRLAKVAEWKEKVIKKALFDCQDCGDCSLFDCQYMCPGSKCKKNQRNGPCGGSRGPLCESADVPCIWYRAYHRAKKAKQLDTFLKRDLIIRNQSLKGTSSWSNYFLGRDHSAEADEQSDEKSDAKAKPKDKKADAAKADAKDKKAEPKADEKTADDKGKTPKPVEVSAGGEDLDKKPEEAKSGGEGSKG